MGTPNYIGNQGRAIQFQNLFFLQVGNYVVQYEHCLYYISTVYYYLFIGWWRQNVNNGHYPKGRGVM